MSSSKRLKELAAIMESAPKGSAKYKAAMKELDRILGMPSEIKPEVGQESYNEESPE
jgi:hypothetical protein